MNSDLTKMVNWEAVEGRMAKIACNNVQYQEAQSAAYAQFRDWGLSLDQITVIEDQLTRAWVFAEEVAYSLGYADGGKMMATLLLAE